MKLISQNIIMLPQKKKKNTDIFYVDRNIVREPCNIRWRSVKFYLHMIERVPAVVDLTDFSLSVILLCYDEVCLVYY